MSFKAPNTMPRAPICQSWGNCLLHIWLNPECFLVRNKQKKKNHFNNAKQTHTKSPRHYCCILFLKKNEELIRLGRQWQVKPFFVPQISAGAIWVILGYFLQMNNVKHSVVIFLLMYYYVFNICPYYAWIISPMSSFVATRDDGIH